MDGLRTELGDRSDKIDDALQKLYEKRVDAVQRIETIETERLPERVTRIEDHIGLPSLTA